MTIHEHDALDAKLQEINERLRLLEKIRREVEALGRRGNREQAFMAGRRSMAYERSASGGVGAAQLGQEILFLLPDEFVEFYGNLFHEALRVADGSKTGQGGEAQKAKGNTGTVLGSDTRLQSAGTGKKYKANPLVIGSDAALQVKDGVDKELRRLTSEASSALAGLRAARQGLERSGNGHASDTRTARHTTQCHNPKCRSFLKSDWDFCPRCGEAVKRERE